MKEWYTTERAAGLRKKARINGSAALGIAGLALAGCVALCLGVRTRNADARRLAAILLSALGSWAALFLRTERQLPLLREAEHEEGVLKEPPEILEGEFQQPGEKVSIPKSITFRKGMLRDGEKETALKLNTVFEKEFPPAGKKIRAEVRRGYITGWEAMDE